MKNQGCSSGCSLVEKKTKMRMENNCSIIISNEHIIRSAYEVTDVYHNSELTIEFVTR